MKTKNLRKNVMLLAPLFGLVALLVAFFIIGTSKNINVAYGMKSIINQSVVVAVVATGAIFIYTLGSFDISLGASVAVSALVGGIVYNKTESLVIMFAACLGVAVFIGLFNSVLASIFNLPVFVTTIAMLSVLNALVTDGYGVSFVANKELTSFPGVLNYVLVIVIGLVLFIAIFDYTQFGYEYKSLLSGQKVSVNTGIHEVSNAVICYTIAGGFMGVVGFISASNTGNIQMSLNFGSIGVMFTAFLPMFIGGFIGRFCNEKIGYLLGAVTTAFISLMYARLNVDASIQQIVTAVILVLFLIYLNNENKVIELVMLKKQLKKKRQEDN